MKILTIFAIIGLCLFAQSACSDSANKNTANSNSPGSNSTNKNANTAPTSTPSTSATPLKADPTVKAQAQKIADSGAYHAGEPSLDGPRGANGCTCEAKVSIMFTPGDTSMEPVRLCIGKGHTVVNDFAAIHSGDLIQFELSDTVQDPECADNPATFLKVKK